MPRLFIAVHLPDTVTTMLAAIQPQPAPGIRLVDPDQMHLTLHFLGEVDKDRAERLADALDGFAGSAFSLVIEGVGQFLSPGGVSTLWAGVRENTGLRELHAALARTLAKVGFRQETRPYTPHIAIARCELEAPVDVVSEFLTRQQNFSLPALPVAAFCLWSSVFVGDVPVYQRERAFALRDVGS
jgi:2'-5' RNA ligase